MKPYSKLPIRERIAVDLERIDRDIAFYTECGPEWSDKVEDLQAHKKRLEEKAGHYDREAAEGYDSPASHRNGISTPGEMSGQSIDL